MSRQYTPEQRAAIESVEGNILVSAGAGSGKTMVLTERVINLFRNHNVKFPEMLVLTFTRLAAAEMKNRIRNILSKLGHHDASSLVESSFITTFDAYALSIVKKYGYLKKIPSQVDIMDDILYDINLARIIDEVMEEHYQEEDAGFRQFIIEYMDKNDAKIKTWLMQSYKTASLSGDVPRFIGDYARNYFSPEYINRRIAEYENGIVSEIADLLEAAGKMHVNAVKNTESQNLQAQTVKTIGQLIEFGEFRKIKKNELKIPKDDETEEETAAREKYNARVADINKLLKNGNRAEIERSYTDTVPYVKVMLTLLEEIDKRIFAFQQNRGAYRFSEIAKIATDLLSIQEVGDEVKSQIRFIMIDEYQDTSDLQENFIGKIARNNVFMVGDIKQSIYAFRQANCDIFAEKLDKYGRGEGGRLITLPQNFRSRHDIVKDVNEIFSSIMSMELGGADFRKSHKLTSGNREYVMHDDKSFFYGINVALYDDEEYEEENNVIEARLIGLDIIGKIRNKYKFTETVDGQPVLRDAVYDDFAILIDRSTPFDDFRKVFSEMGIPLYAVDDEKITTTHVVMVLQNIIHLLVNWDDLNLNDSRYRHYIASILRSYLFGESDQMIFDILSGVIPFERHTLYALMKGLHEDKKTYGVDGMVEEIIRRFAFLEKLPLLGDIESNKRYLYRFMQLASGFAGYGYLLGEFAEAFNLIGEYGIEIKTEPDYSPAGAVKLMTIHKSKGLGFKFVYYAGFSRSYNEPESKNQFVSTLRDGFLLPNYKTDNPKSVFMSMAAENIIASARSEKMRWLYVALTRPMEGGLIIMPEKKFLDEETVKDRSDMRSFKELLASSQIAWGNKNVVIDASVVSPDESPDRTDDIDISFRTADIPKIPYKKERASLEQPAPDSGENMDYGSHLHYLLSLVDLRKKDLGFVTNAEERKILTDLLADPLFDVGEHEEAYAEWPFLDKETGLRGIIDLLIVRKEEISVIDYKTKNISDENYDLQVRKYTEYVSRTFNKPVKGYLVSVTGGEIRRV